MILLVWRMTTWSIRNKSSTILTYWMLKKRFNLKIDILWSFDFFHNSVSVAIYIKIRPNQVNKLRIKNCTMTPAFKQLSRFQPEYFMIFCFCLWIQVHKIIIGCIGALFHRNSLSASTQCSDFGFVQQYTVFLLCPRLNAVFI